MSYFLDIESASAGRLRWREAVRLPARRDPAEEGRKQSVRVLAQAALDHGEARLGFDADTGIALEAYQAGLDRRHDGIAAGTGLPAGPAVDPWSACL